MTYQGNTTIVWYYTINGSGELVLTSPTIDTKQTLFKAEEKWAWTAVADSTTWQYQKYYNDTGTASITAVAYGNGRWVAGSYSYRPYSNTGINEYQAKMAYSADNGVTWTAVADSKFNFDSEYTGINAIAYGNNRWVAVGSQGKMAYSADNGVTWTAVADSKFGTSDIKAVAYGNNRFVAVGGSGKMAYSANGESWTAVADSTIWDYNYTFNNAPNTIKAGIQAIAYGNNRFVAVGSYGKMAYSANGETWTAVADSTIWQKGTYYSGGSQVYSDINGIAYGNGKWVAVGGEGKMAYSTDNGVTWTAVADSTIWQYTYSGSTYTSNIGDIAYGNGRFVAVGGSKMAYSTDGTNWTAVAGSSTLNSFSIGDIAYGNGRFVAVGSDGKMAYVDW